MGCLCSRIKIEEIDSEYKYIHKKYTTGKTLGKGGSCRVVVATEKTTGSKFALKIMSRKEKINNDLFDKEKDVLASLDHPYIIKFVESHIDPKSLYIVTELCEGGELFDRIVDKNYTITEKRASQYIRSMLEAIKHCHDKFIVHRDIKPENFVFKTGAQDSEMVLIDFGCAKVIELDEEYNDLVGTPYYLAPESAAGNRYKRTGRILLSSDLWAIGIITYVLMTGGPPFNGHSNSEIFSNIIKRPLKFPETVNLSNSFINFCKAILKKSPKRRMTLDKALEDPWVNGEETSDRKFSDELLRVLRQFNQQSKLKKAITKTLVQNMGKEPKKRVEDHFNRLDKDGDGALSVEELSFLLMDMGVPQAKALKDAEAMIASIDDDGSGCIEFEEFAQIWQRKLLSVNESYVQTVFNVLDADGDGDIDAKELAQVLDMNNEGDKEKISEIIREVDTDNDGKINFEEFRAAMLERNDFEADGVEVGYKLDANEVLSTEIGEVDIDELDM